MIIRNSTILALAFALPIAAQDGVQEKADVNSFYKAFYLDKGDTKNKESAAKAIELYGAFIAANKDHKLAGDAAANCVVLLYASGDIAKAEEFGKTHGKLMAAAEEKVAASATDLFAGFGRGGGGGGGRQDNPNQGLVDKLMALHESAEDNKKTRLASAITRLGGARDLMMARFRGMGGNRGGGGGGRGGFGGGAGAGGGRGRGVTKPNIAEMSKADAQKAVATMVAAAERVIDSMASNGQADKADELEAKLDKIQDLVDNGKMKDAQKIIDTLEFGGGGRGGNQGGRRRGDGDAGAGAGTGGGGARRRRG